ncbi:Rv3235 family protein [Arsenicicoccus sp. oral taxon 190]|uniref:Rv3235 family protein n=1 Tax=Arsenicicoccus sp. oral taxon 190 TaxID=1658671 RepID=UPI00067C6A82|nr:Rv3235 family protein [Arsenicicoccus sp. oral taxon 190]
MTAPTPAAAQLWARPAPVIAPRPVHRLADVIDLRGPDAVAAQPALALDFRGADDGFGPSPTSSSDLPCPRAWGQQVSQALVEVLGAHRPVTQLVRWTTTDVYARLARGAQAVPSRHPGRGRRPVVRRVRVDDCRDGVAEVAAVVVVGERVRALAFRMVGRDGRWVIDQLTVG